MALCHVGKVAVNARQKTPYRYSVFKHLFRLVWLYEIISPRRGKILNKYARPWLRLHVVEVDHFSFGNRDSFRQRYLVYEDHWNRNGGPIFFYTGSEMNVEVLANQMGIMYDWAKDFKAMLVFAEHRYYGDSLPYSERSFSSRQRRGYLTTEQALADFAYLIQHIKKTAPGAEKSVVVTFGGGYGGMLAAWMRVRYPHLVKGAYASSAPIAYYSNEIACEKFPRAITDSYKSQSQNCAASIRRSWAIMDKMAATDDGLSFLTEAFHSCQRLTTDSIPTLYQWLKEAYQTMAMLDYPYDTELFGKLPAHPVKEACRFLWNPLQTGEDLVRSLHKAASILYNSSGNAACYSIDGNIGVHAGWMFQTCTELVMPECTNGVEDMFKPKKWDVRKHAKKCQQRFGVTPDPGRLKVLYGGTDLQGISNVIFTNNLRDPWYYGGVLSGNEATTSIVVRNAAHLLDLRKPNDLDPVSVAWARTRAKGTLWRWLTPKLNFFG
ncbi:lysosomal Pro-X carboxypeptidase-like [Dermacentor variabilis]|uniref:lysosomal Pro-X carboxypeptidase-like n=1 Tax=Dermacentor variabilis TaxID=34621 RepID=UPI003F5ADFF5